MTSTNQSFYRKPETPSRPLWMSFFLRSRFNCFILGREQHIYRTLCARSRARWRNLAFRSDNTSDYFVINWPRRLQHSMKYSRRAISIHNLDRHVCYIPYFFRAAAAPTIILLKCWWSSVTFETSATRDSIECFIHWSVVSCDSFRIPSLFVFHFPSFTLLIS